MGSIRAFWLLIMGILLSLSPVIAQLHFDEAMSEDEQNMTGVSTLSPSQKRALEAWFDQWCTGKAIEPDMSGSLSLSVNIDGGKRLKLSDGSVYEIAPSDQDKSAFWITPFPIRILPSNDPNYPVKLVNANNGSSIKAKKVSP